MFVTSNFGSCRIQWPGRGGRALTWSPQGHCVLLLPELQSPTPAVYAAWDRSPCSSSQGRRLPCECGAGTAAWLAGCFNDLQPAAFQLFPQLQMIQQQAQAFAGGPSF